MASLADEFFKKVSEFCDELGFSDDEKEKFTDRAMERKGFRRRTAWDDPEEDSGDFFARRRESKQRRVAGDSKGFFD